MRMPASETFASQGLSKAHVSRIWEQLDEALKAADVMALVQNA
jgi:hypothetical protein